MKFTVPPTFEKVFGILNFKLGADVLPKSPVLLAACLLAFAVAVTLFEGNFYPPLKAAACGIASTIVLALVAVVWARVSGYKERLIQTLAALALGGAIVIFLRTSLGFFIYISPIFAELPEVNIRELEGFVLFPLYVWNIFVFAFLFRRSFRADVPIAFAIAIALVVTVYLSVPTAFNKAL